MITAFLTVVLIVIILIAALYAMAFALVPHMPNLERLDQHYNRVSQSHDDFWNVYRAASSCIHASKYAIENLPPTQIKCLDPKNLPSPSHHEKREGGETFRYDVDSIDKAVNLFDNLEEIQEGLEKNVEMFKKYQKRAGEFLEYTKGISSAWDRLERYPFPKFMRNLSDLSDFEEHIESLRQDRVYVSEVSRALRDFKTEWLQEIGYDQESAFLQGLEDKLKDAWEQI